MAGGGVPEAMLIGAAVGAGTGGVMSAVKDEDPLQGALLGAALGAAGGGIGSAVGGAASGATAGATGGATGGTTGGVTGGTVGGEVGGTVGGTTGGTAGGVTGGASGTGSSLSVNSLLGTGGSSIPGMGASAPSGLGTMTAGQYTSLFGQAPSSQAVLAQSLANAAPSQAAASGVGTGMFPALSTAQAYGAGAGGGIMGLVGQSAQNKNNMAPEPETYTGPLSQFKYSPSTFRPSVAPGYADGGVASLDQSTYPQSQIDKTQFATPSQMPVSREVIKSDYDTRISPYTGDIAMASGGISHLGSYSDGGRLLRGPGDGMSDDIPASIGRKQPARLADGEFVVPADVVSGIGNGSTDAGAKKLYGMMDNIRKARTGTKKQGKSIKADKYMPGMKRGGIAYYDEGGETQTEDKPAEQAAPAATVPGQGAVATGFQATGYEPSQQYSPYTMANRPSSTQPQYYGDIYQGYYPDYSTPGYTLAGNLGQWSNVAGEAQRAAQPMSRAQEITQSYLQNLGRAPEAEGFNYWMQSGLSGPELQQGFYQSPEATAIRRARLRNMQGGIASLV